MIDLSPLCPPAEPRSRMRIVPSGSARSSEITTNCLTGESSSSFANRHDTACPLRFMNVCGFASFVAAFSICPRPTSELHSRRPTTIPSSWANLSINMNPRLCRVHSYSLPGFPKPTINILVVGLRSWVLGKDQSPKTKDQLLATRLPRPLLPSCPCQSLRVRWALHLQPPAPEQPLPSRYRQWQSQ